ncbi:hypothetical protein IMZ48_04405 [Candidatus Bathyarchaeota archaeon]|nr:hypothetical protein [Candidatus Bathyarchaeota archaeon]
MAGDVFRNARPRQRGSTSNAMNPLPADAEVHRKKPRHPVRVPDICARAHANADRHRVFGPTAPVPQRGYLLPAPPSSQPGICDKNSLRSRTGR